MAIIDIIITTISTQLREYCSIVYQYEKNLSLNYYCYCHHQRDYNILVHNVEQTGKHLALVFLDSLLKC